MICGCGLGSLNRERTAIEKNHAGRVFAPWDEIDVRWPLRWISGGNICISATVEEATMTLTVKLPEQIGRKLDSHCK